MKKIYNPAEIEQNLYKYWEHSNYFKANQTKDSAYCISLPPPNVTGNLHMGHGFQISIMDSLIRYHRMLGDKTLWQGGTDHAGIATQMVVERQLLAKGKSRHDLGREAFIKATWKWKQESGGTIEKQLRRMGASIDWSRMRFTMDDKLSSAVQKVFIQLYDEGLIYRGKRLTNWDPVLHTAISNLEVINEEEDSFLWYFRYPLANEPEKYLVISTTRPETMLGDTAVAVHPEDLRYQHLIGKTILLPLVNREIPIIADNYVDPKFGTGCVKITPAHDFNDYSIGQRHHLPLINIFTHDACLNENTPEHYRGLDRFAARKQIIDDLKNIGLLEKTEKHRLKIPRGDRSKAIIEPWLTNQWFLKIEPLAKPAIKAVEDGDIKFIPNNWDKTYFQWMHNIEDWCISRQLWWGHRIPAWYDEAGNIYVAEDEDKVRNKYELDDKIKLTQDDDVLDTWFSSALWPFSTLGWPEKTAELKTFYPTNVLVTGFDIIFFWVARMIMFGLKFTDNIPFNEIYITGLIRDPEGKKMSKSKGNILDPIDLIDGIELKTLIEKRIHGLMQPDMKEKIKKTTKEQFPNGIQAYGTDALRMTFCALANTGRDVSFDLGRLEGYRNFCNKLWNASRYILQRIETIKPDFDKEKISLSLADHWIQSKLQKTIEKVHDCFKKYRFDMLIQILHEFIWHEYCDWYLEFSKVILNDNENTMDLKYGTLKTLLTTLEIILRLLHPCAPFITETLWKEISPLLNISDDTIMLQEFPKSNTKLIDQKSENDLNWIKSIIASIRNIRGEMNISPGKLLILYYKYSNDYDERCFNKYENYLISLARLKKIEVAPKNITACATALINNLEILIPLDGIIDVKSEAARLDKKIKKLSEDLQLCQIKLSNSNFANKAPKDIVQKEQNKKQEIEGQLKLLIGTLNRLKEVN